MTSPALRWWLLQLDAEGKVLSCTSVEQSAANGERWFYVQARDEKAAQRTALNAYMRELQRRRRVELDKAGKCRWCGRKADRGTKRCSICVAKDAVYTQRHNARVRGESVPPLDRRAALAARKTEETTAVVKAAAPSLRLDVLLEVQEAWQSAATNGVFTRWLTDQIAAARGRKVA
jgi:hypothetical protein